MAAHHPPTRRPGRRGAVVAALVLTGAVVAGCSGSSSDGAGSSSTTATVAAPGGTGGRAAPVGAIGVDGVTEWSTVTPAEAGLDPAVLDEMAAEAEQLDSTCFLVVRDGRIAAEHYWGSGGEHEAQEVFSVTKSFASTLVGIAQDDGSLSVEDPASRWITEWDATPSAEVTVADLLSNVSGRFWSFDSDYGRLIASLDRTGYAIGLDQEHEPGTYWAYNNAAIQSLSRVLDRATGEPVPDFGRERLLAPLGMDDSRFGTDGAGNGLTFMGLRSTCRDLARFGVLVLDRGEWNGEQVVSADYLDAATGRPSQDLNAAYGYLFWLNHRGSIASAVSPLSAEEQAGAAEGQLVADRPERLVWALGLGGQVVQMDPGTNTVVVRLGPASFSSRYGPALTARILDGIES